MDFVQEINHPPHRLEVLLTRAEFNLSESRIRLLNIEQDKRKTHVQEHLAELELREELLKKELYKNEDEIKKFDFFKSQFNEYKRYERMHAEEQKHFGELLAEQKHV
jgi:hypothetical protein